MQVALLLKWDMIKYKRMSLFIVSFLVISADNISFRRCIICKHDLCMYWIQSHCILRVYLNILFLSKQQSYIAIWIKFEIILILNSNWDCVNSDLTFVLDIYCNKKRMLWIKKTEYRYSFTSQVTVSFISWNKYWYC